MRLTAEADPIGAVFLALADPTRRHVVELLAAAPGELPQSALAAELPMSRQAVAKHLDALGSAGIVRAHRAGRETRYALSPGALAPAAAWMARVGGEWDDRLARLAAALGG